jgi:hypothetical protein
MEGFFKKTIETIKNVRSTFIEKMLVQFFLKKMLDST